MHIYSVSPDLFKNNGGLDDEYDSWLYGCFKSKWDKHRDEFGFDTDLDEFKPEVTILDTIEHKEFEPNILKAD
jgi:hypothetical protein